MDQRRLSSQKRGKIEKRLKEEIQKCIILDPEDRDFWLSQIDILPNNILENVISIVEKKNKLMDEYISAALEKDLNHLYLTKLKQHIQLLKEKAFAIDESGEKTSAEILLEEELNRLNE